MPRERWFKVPLGTKVKVTFQGRSVIVKINDRGAGDGSMDRVLDLSRSAMSKLVGWEIKSDVDARRAGIIQVEIEEVISDAHPASRFELRRVHKPP